VERHFDVSVSFETLGCTAVLASGTMFVDIGVQSDCLGVKQEIHLLCYQICNSSILGGQSDPQAGDHWHHWRDGWRFVPLPARTISARRGAHAVAPSVLSAFRTPPPLPPRLSRATRCCTPRPPLVPSAILAPPSPVTPFSTLLSLSTARLLATTDRPPSCAASKALVERGVIPPLGGAARLLVPAHDVAADRRQRRPWRGEARATVSDSTAAVFRVRCRRHVAGWRGRRPCPRRRWWAGGSAALGLRK